MSSAENPDLVSLREFLEARITELDAQLHRGLEDIAHRIQKQAERGAEQIESMKEAMAEQRQEAIRLQKADVERANIASLNLEHRLDDLNHLRRQMEQERGLYVDRDRLDSTVKGLEQRFENLGTRMDVAERARANMDGRMTATAAFLLGLSVVINLLLTVSVHYWGK